MTATGTVTIQGFSHVAIVASDVDEARRFYCDLLGFEELPRPDFSVPGIWLRVGDLQLHIIELDESGASAGARHFALHVPTDALHDTVNALREAGVHVRNEPSSRVDFGT